MYFNVFEAAPENERDGPNQQPQNAGGKVCFFYFLSSSEQSPFCISSLNISYSQSNSHGVTFN